MQDLSPEDRRRIHALMQSDPVLLERVMVAVSEHDLTMRIASAVTAQNALSVIAEKANEILARFAAVEERLQCEKVRENWANLSRAPWQSQDEVVGKGAS